MQLEERTLLSSVPVLVEDINTIGMSSEVGPAVEWNGAAYFGANDGAGFHLYKTDGTPEGTVQVHDRGPGEFAVIDGGLYFASGGLWRTDGTEAGTVELDLGLPGIKDMVVTSGGALFTCDSKIGAGLGMELWRWDGKSPHATMLRQFEQFLSPQLADVEGTVFFFGWADSAIGLWKSDGTEAGTVKVTDAFSYDFMDVRDLTAAGSKLFFRATYGSDLWTSDGTEAGTVKLTDSGSVDDLTALGEAVHFTMDDLVHGCELWRSDGTQAGTGLVKDILPGSGSSDPDGLTVFNGKLYFSVNGGTLGRELWMSDGTDAGTVMVADICPGSGHSWANGLASVGETLYFVADDGVNGPELWKSDGTAQGTLMVGDVTPGPAGYTSYAPIGSVGTTLLFAGSNTVDRPELWKSDGTLAGTILLKDINTDNLGSNPRTVVQSGGRVFYTADDGIHGREVWVSDGTEAGTMMVKDIAPPGKNLMIRAMEDVNGTVFFVTETEWGGNFQLWKTDGTEIGTQQLKSFQDLQYVSFELANVDGTLFFCGPGTYALSTLWKSDGTEAGTVPILDRWDACYEPARLTAFNGNVYFTAYDFSHGRELWKSDGTAAGTGLWDIRPGGWSSSPDDLTVVNDTLFFRANDGVYGHELWRTDGTSAWLVKDIRPGPDGSKWVEGIYWGIHASVNVNGTLFFMADEGTNGLELWKSDGTEAGTVIVRDIAPGDADSSIRWLTNSDGTLFFQNGDDLWKSDGTALGTMLVKSMAQMGPLTPIDGRLFFPGYRDTDGWGLWTSDGNATVRLADIPEDTWSKPENLTNVNGTLFFSTDDGIHGSELWKLDTSDLFRTAQIDVAPDRASVNVASNGLIAVWILTTETFDASTVNAASVDFAGGEVVQSALEDVDKDGDLDMVLHFRIEDTMLDEVYAQLLAEDLDGDGMLDSSRKTATASLAGRTSDGELFEGSDTVNLSLSGRALRELLDQLYAEGLI